MNSRARPPTGGQLRAVPVALVLSAQVQRSSDLAERQLTWVIAGLIALAILIAGATVWFWRATRPEPVDESWAAMRWTDRGLSKEGVPPQGAPTAARRPDAVSTGVPPGGDTTRRPPSGGGRAPLGSAGPDPVAR